MALQRETTLGSTFQWPESAYKHRKVIGNGLVWYGNTIRSTSMTKTIAHRGTLSSSIGQEKLKMNSRDAKNIPLACQLGFGS